jgi:hypothetical protein
MMRSLIAGLLVFLVASSAALAQACVGNPMAVQILGSGAPGDLDAAVADAYTRPLTVGADLQCTQVRRPGRTLVRRVNSEGVTTFAGTPALCAHNRSRTILRVRWRVPPLH